MSGLIVKVKDDSSVFGLGNWAKEWSCHLIEDLRRADWGKGEYQELNF